MNELMHYNQRTKIAPTDPMNPCADHTEGPEGYNHWHDWAARMGQTHRQLRCAGCGLYKIWVRKDAIA
jgi:hypothetical protein